jgi:hypothetical protein
MSARSVRPGREEIDRTHRALVRAFSGALGLADRGGPDFAGSLAAALQDLNRAHNQGAWRLVESRSGSWEAGHVTALAATEMDWGL